MIPKRPQLQSISLICVGDGNDLISIWIETIWVDEIFCTLISEFYYRRIASLISRPAHWNGSFPPIYQCLIFPTGEFVRVIGCSRRDPWDLLRQPVGTTSPQRVPTYDRSQKPCGGWFLSGRAISHQVETTSCSCEYGANKCHADLGPGCVSFLIVFLS